MLFKALTETRDNAIFNTYEWNTI